MNETQLHEFKEILSSDSEWARYCNYDTYSAGLCSTYFVLNDCSIFSKWITGTNNVSTILKAIYELEQQQLITLNPKKSVRSSDHPALIKFKTDVTQLAFSIIQQQYHKSLLFKVFQDSP